MINEKYTNFISWLGEIKANQINVSHTKGTINNSFSERKDGVENRRAVFELIIQLGNHITNFVKIEKDIPYGILFDGCKTVYYNDEGLNLNQKTFNEVMFNFFILFLSGAYFHPNKNKSLKSNIALFLAYFEMENIELVFTSVLRSQYYEKFYVHSGSDFLIIEPNDELASYFYTSYLNDKDSIVPFFNNKENKLSLEAERVGFNNLHCVLRFPHIYITHGNGGEVRFSKKEFVLVENDNHQYKAYHKRTKVGREVFDAVKVMDELMNA